MIISFVTKIFKNMLVFKILNEGIMVNHHITRVTKPKLELYPDIALKYNKAYFESRYFFYLKIAGPIIFKMAR